MAFLQLLKQTNIESHKSMVNRYKMHGERGPTNNPRQERRIKSHGNLWKFKTDQGDRLLYFNISGNRIVLVSGFHKGEPEQQRYDEASNLRDAYLQGGGS